MTLTLTIENEQSLPNGAPVSVRLTDGRGVDIGRSANAEWSLPDPTRFISGRHCEVRFRDGSYWLNDLSTNGTFLNDSTRRIQAPHRLRDGDRLAIGSYIIAVSLDAGAEAEPPAPQAASAFAPFEPGADADINVQIAHAIAIETASGIAPAPDSAPRAAEPLRPDTAPLEEAFPREVAPLEDFNSAARDAAAAAGKPFTMVRARGFFGAPAPGRDTASPVAPSFDGAPQGRPAAEAESPWFAPLPSAAFGAESQHVNGAHAAEEESAASAEDLGLREQEALAWGVGERAAAPTLEAPASAAPPQSAFAESEPGPLPDLASAGPSQTIEPQISEAAAPHAAAAPAAAPAAPTAEDFLRSFAKGAGIPEHIFTRQNSLKVAEDLGALMRLSVEDLTQLLSARFKAKRFARTSSQTMIQALDNNPLKFAPTPEDALKIMFGPRTSGYLDAKRAFESAFTDLKTHQINTFAAMQQAVRMLVEDLDPKAIEEVAGKESGLAALLGGHKARLWDLYLARWQAKTLRHEDGLVDAFMLYFAQCYDQAKDTK